MKKSAISIIVIFAFMTVAKAQDVSPRVKSAAFLEVIAERGVDCGLMKPWQAASLRALNLRDMNGWSFERRQAFQEETARRLKDTDCTNEAMNVWIEGASRGFESEMLAPYLIVYRTIVGYESPPEIFTQTTVRLRYGPVVKAINAKLEEIQESGAPAEGGKPWPEYVAGIEEAARGFVSTLSNPDASHEEREQAAIFIAQTAHIVELWMLETPAENE